MTGNYNNASGTVADNIAKADAACTVTPYNVTYDGLPHTATGHCTGVGGAGDVLAGLDLSGTTHTAAGSYPADPWTFTDSTGNYNNQNGTVADNIGKAELTVTADNKTRVYGAPNPALTYQITGFVNGEILSTSGVTGTPVLSTTATTASDVGPYPITTAIGTLAASNYSFALVNGTLEITKAATTTVITNAIALGTTSTTVGQSYAVNWTTSPVAPSTGTPTGTVTVTDGTNICTAPVATGTCNLTATTAGCEDDHGQLSGRHELHGQCIKHGAASGGDRDHGEHQTVRNEREPRRGDGHAERKHRSLDHDGCKRQLHVRTASGVRNMRYHTVGPRQDVRADHADLHECDKQHHGSGLRGI